MAEKPFYKSKKFAYAVAGVLAALILALLPSLFTLTAETQALLEDVVPAVVLICVLLLTGHTVTDIAYAWAERPTAQPLGQALHALIDATPLAERAADDPALVGEDQTGSASEGAPETKA